MATDSLLPLFHQRRAEPMVERPTEPDDVLAELLGGAGVRPRSFSERRLN